MQALKRTPRTLALGLAVSVSLALGVALVAPASAHSAFGSIAVNPNTGGAGISHGKRTRKKAMRRARRACPGKCKTVGWVRNGCAAVYRTDIRYFWGAARKRKRAINRAKRRARRSDTGRARRVAWVCSG